jgi:alpha-glucosidase (family GH31 glycosyl hydrolase)
MNEVIFGKRRFTCLSPRLVRMEFSPTGVFEDRRSLVAYAPRWSLPFDAVEQTGDRLVLKTGALTVISTQNDSDFFPANLKVEWKQGRCTQTWQFGDRDFRNLGGTVRSLDGYDRDSLLKGVHPASNDSPDSYLHDHREYWAVQQVYQQDGNLDWMQEVDRQGVCGAYQHMPEVVYNHYVNLAEDLTRYQPGLLSRSGYFLLNDSTGAVLDADDFPIERDTPGARDLYFFGYGLDYPAALADFTRLSGPIPLPPRNVFGIFFSRWPAFDEAESRAIVARFEQEGIPLSVLVIDLEWHVPDWWHWDWNPQAFADPEGFLRWAHSKDLLVTLNVHPDLILSTDSHFDAFIDCAACREQVAPLPEAEKISWKWKNGAEEHIPLDLSVKAQVRALKTICCAPIIRQGADFWWLDGSSGFLNGADTQLIASKPYYETAEVDGKRGMLLGRYGGLGSHRYGVFFTGDTLSQWEVLESQCEFNIRAGQVGMAYVSHDLGGFSHPDTPLIDPLRYMRWLEFGVFNPVMRFHSAPGAGSRSPWDYGAANLEIARRWLKLRNSLVPYLYTAARQAYDSGLPIVRGLYLEHPADPASYRFDEYLFGDAFLVAPILTPSDYRQVYLPEGRWFDFASGRPLQGGREFTVYAELDQIPVYVKAGAVVVRQDENAAPCPLHIQELLLDLYPDPAADGALRVAELYEDDNRSLAYRQGQFARTRFALAALGTTITLRGEALQGAAFGADRHIRLRVALPTQPASVTLQGAALPAAALAYDPAVRRLCVDLGVVAVDQAWEVRIEQGESPSA